jgi:methionine biosynthesis protein MetW
MEDKFELKDNFSSLSFEPEGLDRALWQFLATYNQTPKVSSVTYGRRWQDEVIIKEIPKGSYVLDLGCGQGDLLSFLIKEKMIRGQGVEVDPEAAMEAMEHGVPVLNVDLDEVLEDFSKASFDYVILESTLQTLKDPLKVLQAMLRGGRRGIVSFPNFAYYQVRVDLAVRGRMPITPGLPYGWHNTPNIHLFTLADFLDWCQGEKVKIVQGFVLSEGKVRSMAEKDNLFAEEVLLFLQKH